MKEQLSKIKERLVAEQATGICETSNGLGTYYAEPPAGSSSGKGASLSPEGARKLLDEGGGVSVPNAGAGSYREFFESLGYTDARTVETTSSAGDWCLAVCDERGGMDGGFPDKSLPVSRLRVPPGQ